MITGGSAGEQPPMLQAAPEHQNLPPQSAHILAAETCALGGSARVGQEQDLSQTVMSSLGAHAVGWRL